jgi:hypothetical protein
MPINTSWQFSSDPPDTDGGANDTQQVQPTQPIKGIEGPDISYAAVHLVKAS